jgi:hypothetical protein
LCHDALISLVVLLEMAKDKEQKLFT